MRAVVSELVTSAPDVIVARGTSVLNSVRQATKSIPVAFVGISDPEGVGIVDNVSASPRRNGNHYAPTNFPLLRIRPDPSRFYDRGYGPILRSMVESTLKQEAPIYEDVLVVRIARAHGFQRSGDRLQNAVSKVLGKRYRKTHEDGRAVIWADNSPEGRLVSYRESNRKSGPMRTHPSRSLRAWHCPSSAFVSPTKTFCTGWQATFN
jgi:hypothetical protein